jgi:hypothetical protein
MASQAAKTVAEITIAGVREEQDQVTRERTSEGKEEGGIQKGMSECRSQESE